MLSVEYPIISKGQIIDFWHVFEGGATTGDKYQHKPVRPDGNDGWYLDADAPDILRGDEYFATCPCRDPGWEI
jgi:hypothetical protein